MAEDIRHTLDMKTLYDLRKETIERIFGSAKEYHGFRYTNMIGKAQMMKDALTFACLNLKKTAKILGGIPSLFDFFLRFLQIVAYCLGKNNKLASAVGC